MSETIRGVLQFAETVVDDFTVTPTESGAKGVLVLRHELTESMAEALDCAWVFGSNLEGGAKLALVLRDTMVSLPRGDGGFDTHYPEKIARIRVERAGGEDAETVEMVLRIHLTKSFDSVLGMVERVNKAPFEMPIQSRQGELFEGGARVDMAPPPEKQEEPASAQDELFAEARKDGDDDGEASAPGRQCVMCEDEVPLDDEGFHTKKMGRRTQRVKCLKNHGGPVLSSRRDMEKFVQ